MTDPNRSSADIPKGDSSKANSPKGDSTTKAPAAIDFSALLNSPSINPRKRRPADPRTSLERSLRSKIIRPRVPEPSRPRTQSSLPAFNTKPLDADSASGVNSPSQAPAGRTPNPLQDVRTTKRAYYTARARAIAAQRQADNSRLQADNFKRQADNFTRWALQHEARESFSANTTRGLGESEVPVAIRDTVGLEGDEVVARAARGDTAGDLEDEDDEVWRGLVRRNGGVTGEGEGGDEE